MVRRRVYCLRYPSTTLPDTHEEKTKFFFISSEQSPKRYTDETAQTLIDTGFEPYLLRKLRFQRDPIVKPEHMPEAHRKYLHYNKEEFEAWAVTIGPNTEKVVHHFLTDGKEAEQGYKSCASLTKLEKSYGAKRLEDACERVLALASAPTIRNITLLIKTKSTGKDTEKDTAASAQRETASHGITRGAAYYSRGGQLHE